MFAGRRVYSLFYSDCRSLLPVPGAEGSICKTEAFYCFLVDFILRVTITRFLQTFKWKRTKDSRVLTGQLSLSAVKDLNICFSC